MTDENSTSDWGERERPCIVCGKMTLGYLGPLLMRWALCGGCFNDLDYAEEATDEP